MESPKGTLYLIPTPIGNLEDMTYRAVRILSEVDLVAAEDTRHTGLLLKHFNIDTKLISYHEHNKVERGIDLVNLLESGQSIGLVSDAGMPAISDPGADLVELALMHQIPVVPLPGANAALKGLIASGLDTKEFTFIGFWPKRTGSRRDELERIKNYEGTLIFYETPHRIQEILDELYTHLGDRPITIGRELTKKFETFTYSTLQTLRDTEEAFTIRGEFVLIVGGATTSQGTVAAVTTVNYVDLVKQYMRDGLTKKLAIREVAIQCNVSRRDVYNAVEQEFEEN